MQLGTNHLGHFALTGLLLSLLVDTADARVVTISSNAHKPGRIHFDDLMLEASYGRWTSYMQSKLANPVVHFRTAAPARSDQRAVDCRRRASRLCLDQPDQPRQQGQPAEARRDGDRRPPNRSVRRARNTAAVVRRDSTGRGGVRTTSALTASANSGAIPSWSTRTQRRKTPRPRRGCGRSPKISRVSGYDALRR